MNADGQRAKPGESLYAAETEAEVARLAALELGWDGEDGQPIDPDTLAKAAALALLLAASFPSYHPQLVPLSDGSVQVEWHSDGFDVEMWVCRV